MPTIEEMQLDLQSLHDSIDQEASLQDIRIAALRALTRHRFFTEEVMKATGDWEPMQQWKERMELHAKFCREHTDEIKKMTESRVELKEIAAFVNSHVPHLPKEISERARYPLGDYIKSIVHKIADVCVWDREEAANDHWEREAGQYEDELAQTTPDEFFKGITPERRKEIMENFRKYAEQRKKDYERREQGMDDDLTMGEIVSDDESYERNRRRVLKEDGQQLDMYLLILQKRLATNGEFSGLELIHDQDEIPGSTEKPDWEEDEEDRNEREGLIVQLETLTGTTFR